MFDDETTPKTIEYIRTLPEADRYGATVACMEITMMLGMTELMLSPEEGAFETFLREIYNESLTDEDPEVSKLLELILEDLDLLEIVK